MNPRIESPVKTFRGVLPAMTRLRASVDDAGLSDTTRWLVEVRVSQINGCAVCLDMHTRELQNAGESTARVATVAAWREAPYFTPAERAALALAEAGTRLADRPEAVPDVVWQEAARHYTQEQLGALVVTIATINAWNRIQAVSGQVSGDWVDRLI